VQTSSWNQDSFAAIGEKAGMILWLLKFFWVFFGGKNGGIFEEKEILNSNKLYILFKEL